MLNVYIPSTREQWLQSPRQLMLICHEGDTLSRCVLVTFKISFIFLILSQHPITTPFSFLPYFPTLSAGPSTIISYSRGIRDSRLGVLIAVVTAGSLKYKYGVGTRSHFHLLSSPLSCTWLPPAALNLWFNPPYYYS